MQNKYSFRFLWLGQSLANLADPLYIMSLVSIIYSQTHSTLLSALVPVVRLGMVSIGGVIAPILMERFPLAKLLSLSQTLQTVLLATMVTIGFAEGDVHLWMWLLVAMISFLDGWTKPTRNALIPILVPKADLMKANSQVAVSDQVVSLVGWSSGGILVSQFDRYRFRG